MAHSDQRGWRNRDPVSVTQRAIPRPIYWLLTIYLIFFTGLVIAQSCPDDDGDNYADCSGSCDDTGLQCGDCDDNDSSINPGATEQCNGVDDDCDGDVDADDDDFPELNSDGNYGTCIFKTVDLPSSVCEIQGNLFCDLPPGDEALGFTCRAPDDLCPDNDGDGYVVCESCDEQCLLCDECDDNDADINPGATERCNNVDDNCNGLVDGDDSDFPAFDTLTTDPDATPVDEDSDGFFDEGYGICVFHVDQACITGGASLCEFPRGGDDVLYEATDSSEETFGHGVFTCSYSGDVLEYEEESIAAGTCSDGVDNDCDDLVDLEEPDCQGPEVCDSIDNNGDGQVDEGFNVGVACTSGTGECERGGFTVCTADAMGTECSAVPGMAADEGSAFSGTCDDGLDNDCDGASDGDDIGCALFGQPELCGNAIDDNGNGLTDEGYPTVGQECASGTGACRRVATVECTADLLDVACTAEPGEPTETPEVTCDDFIDNDCDGFTDAEDVDCAGTAADLGVTCSLPYRVGRRPADCAATHIITFDGGQATEVRADLIAMDADGNALEVISDVQNGDIAYLASRSNPRYWRVYSSPFGGYHSMFHLNPMLRVIGTDESGREDTAYCGIVPFINVLSPANQTLSAPEEDTIEVEVITTLVDVDTLRIEFDGNELVETFGIDPVSAFPGDGECANAGECSFPLAAGCGIGTLSDVEVTELIVEGLDSDLAPTTNEGVAAPNQVNRLRFRLSNLPIGGHLFRLTADPLPETPLSRNCYADDLFDVGPLSSFGIVITNPADQEEVGTASVPVEGVVCGGKPVTRVAINGMEIDPLPDEATQCEGDNLNTAQECQVDVGEDLTERRLVDAIAGDAQAGTVLRGSNRVIADASDEDGGRTFNIDTIFGFGNDIGKPVGGAFLQMLADSETATFQLGCGEDERDAAAIAALEAAYGERMKRYVTEVVNPTMMDTLADLKLVIEDEIARALADSDVDPAFVIGLEEDGAQDLFNSFCEVAIATFEADVEANLPGATFGTFDVKPDCSCNLNDVPLKLDTLDFTPWSENNDTPTCAVDFQDGAIALTVHLPDVNLAIKASDSCTTRFLGVCIARTRVNVRGEVNIIDVDFDVTISENQLETRTPDQDSLVTNYTVTDSDGRELISQEGSCSQPSGMSCTCTEGSDPCGACYPVVSSGVCAAGSNEGNSCSSDSNCPFDTGGRNNKCTGGEQQGRSCESDADCPGGACYAKCVGTCSGAKKNDDFDPLTEKSFPIQCIGGVICTFIDSVVRFAISIVAEIFTLGDFDTKGFILAQFGAGDFQFQEDFLDSLNLGDADSVCLADMGVDEDEFEEDSGNSSFSEDASFDVTIGDEALTAAFGASFASQCDDSEVAETPGVELTQARSPTPDEIAAAGAEATVLIADDVFNMAFSSMKECGQLKAFCITPSDDPDTPEDDSTLAGLLPDCESIETDNEASTALAKGVCYAIKGEDCDDFSGVTQGACYGFSGQDCATLGIIPRAACNQTASRNISSTDDILFCARVDNDPTVGILEEDASDRAVGIDIAISQLNVVVAIDRAGEGYSDDLGALDSCFDEAGQSDSVCRLIQTCLDLGIQTEAGIDSSNCAANEVGFALSIQSVVPSSTQFGVMCDAADESNDQSTLESTFESRVTELISENAEKFAPSPCIEGLNLCGVLDFDSQDSKLFGITTDGLTEGYADFLGITVDLGTIGQ